MIVILMIKIFILNDDKYEKNESSEENEDGKK